MPKVEHLLLFERAPAAFVVRANLVSQVILIFCKKPVIIEHLINLCFAILIANAILLRESMDPTGAGPRETWSNRLVSNRQRSMSSLYIVTLLI